VTETFSAENNFSPNESNQDLYSDDKPKEACGVFGVYAPQSDVARITYFGLFALQHRGQESAGICTSTGSQMACYARMGLVNQVFTEKMLSVLKGSIASGHVRYSTTGSSNEENAQPILVEGYKQVGNNGPRQEYVTVALAHNGNLVNTKELRAKCDSLGIELKSTSDSELMARLIHYYYDGDIESALMQTLPTFRGAFAMVVQTPRELVAIRDHPGIRPLVFGSFISSSEDEGWVVASETCALDIVGAKYEHDVEPGTALIIDGSGPRVLRWSRANPGQENLCSFEYIYFARPDSIFRGKSIHQIRQRMGEILAREAPVEADIVVAVPDSGTPHAIGFAKASGISYSEGLIKNRYVGRTFINPQERLRALGVRMKLNPLTEVLRGKRVVLVDDSIVRGTTSKQIIQLLRDAGAVEVHFRVASPPVLNPCYYGIDTAVQEQLIASRYYNKENNYEKLGEYLGADSLAYLSREGMLEAFGHDKSEMCMACLDGDYPIPISAQTRLGLGKFMLEKDESGNGKASDSDTESKIIKT